MAEKPSGFDAILWTSLTPILWINVGANVGREAWLDAGLYFLGALAWSANAIRCWLRYARQLAEHREGIARERFLATLDDLGARVDRAIADASGSAQNRLRHVQDRVLAEALRTGRVIILKQRQGKKPN